MAINKEKHKKHFKLAIFLTALVIFIGGTLIAVLIHLYINGNLDKVSNTIHEFLRIGGVMSVLLVFWVLVIPILLIVLLVINIKRRKKFNEMQKVWREALQIAAFKREEEEAKAEAERKKQSRFGILSELDGRKFYYPQKQFNKVKSLKEMCDRFHEYLGINLKLYYSISDIREFVAGLAVSRILILQGMSGTGKTSIANAFGMFIGNPSVIIPVQPMWKERTDLLGYYNEFTKRFNETLLLQKMYEASGQEKIYIAVLDEMNIARVEYYFAEFLSLLEIPNAESRYIDIVPDKWHNDPSKLKDGRLKLPENMWFIGTINNDDSTFAISDKVYDRAMILNFNRKCEELALPSSVAPTSISLTLKDFEMLIKDAQNRYEMTARNKRRLHILDEYLIDKFQITFGNRIMKQIQNYISVYMSCGGEELDGLDDFLAKKVLRKLEAQNSAYVRNEANGLCEFLDELFGEGKMVKCHEYITRFTRSM